ncbi:N-acetylmuramoyl-L-alanine amidase [Planococcus sp. ISL-109]|uniref:N-acetylmuramoyl-L-alanine amidase family protein n=1 Tax=Planococcus sp. ISL-109 TaxID=2819166 RepID=UPI001BEA51B6|nr:N-acetylmuramoyl-L-alanine amidase [Planococcus sp. ISL-109]MBT2583720.1 N-acetylmuramoyl-L-alanine amidase [Planococcus sp. ISL-109]
MKILIDAGHGPATYGKRTPDGRMREFHFNAAVAEEVKKRLAAEGYTVLFSHQADRDVPLVERTRFANRTGADLLVSIHANAAGTGGYNAAEGIECFVYPAAPARTRKFGELLQNSLVVSTRRKNRGLKTADFAMLRDTSMPAVLVECGFMTNKQEAALLQSTEYRKRCARAITFAITCMEI